MGEQGKFETYKGRSMRAEAAVVELRERLAAAERERDEYLWFIQREGYRRCDIPACNCNSWHGGNASDRLMEIDNALGMRTQGVTILDAVVKLVEADEAGEGERGE